MNAFQRASLIQVRVIGALMLRDLVLQGGRDNIPFGNIWMRPIGMIAAFYIVGRVATGLTPQGLPLLVFIVTGYMTWHSFVRCFANINFRRVGGLLMFPHVTPLDYILSRMVVEFVVFSLVFVLLCLLGMLFEQAAPPADPLGVMMAFWTAIALGVSLGMIASSISRFTSILEDLFAAVRVAGNAVSGVFLLATDTPQPILDVLKWNPLFHCVEWMRQSWWAEYKSPIADPPYIFCCLFFLIAIGLAFERASRRWQAE